MSPSRLPLMETSDNNATSSPASAPDNSRRRSGRVVRAPQKFSPDPHPSQNDQATSKRKRGTDRDEEDVENESPGEDEDEELSDLDDEEDEVEDDPASRSRRSKQSKQKSRPKKPAAKRAKVNGNAPANAVSASHAPAVKLPNRPKKNVRVTIAHPDGDGLYGESLS